MTNRALIPGSESFEHHTDGDVACLLIHGFIGTPDDMRLLAQKLYQMDIASVAPLLKGHGTTSDDLNAFSWSQIEADLEEQLIKLARRYKKIIIVGESSGAINAVRLSLRHPDKVAGIVSIGGSLVYPFNWLLRLIVFVLSPFKKNFPRSFIPAARDKETLSQRVRYNSIPLKSIKELIKYSNRTTKMLADLRAPLLIMQAKHEFTISRKNARLFYKHTGSTFKKILRYHNSYHLLLIDYDKETAIKDIIAFAKNIEAGAIK